MRTLMIAALALSSLAPLPRDAEACGGYRPEPSVLRLTTHDGAAGPRSFVILAERVAAPDGLSWSRIADRNSFDATEVASAPALTAPVTFTLVGPSGARVVTLTSHVFLRRWHANIANALEVSVRPDEQFTLAVAGARGDAKWIAVDHLDARHKPVAWLAANGVTATADAISVARLHGSDRELVSVYDAKRATTLTYIKQGDLSLGAFTGDAVAAFTTHGTTLLVIARDTGYYTVPLGAA